MQKLIAQTVAFVKQTLNLPLKALVKIYPTKIFSRTSHFLSLILIFFAYIVNPTIVAADFLKVTSPAEITQDTPFEINLEISAQPNSSYFVKARLGNEINQLRFGQTLNETKNVWLSDTVSWQDFPQFSTDNNGVWVGKIHAKAASNAKLGSNYLVIRIHSQSGTNTDSATYAVTVAEEQKTPPPTPPKPIIQDSGNPILNEFMPQPQTGSKEWVEIKNKGTAAADLSGWKVDDEAGKSSPQVLAAGTIIQPGGFLVVTFDSPKLNDLTDSVRLLKPNDSVVESYSYPETERGQTWSKDSQGNWFLTSSVSPNAENPNPPNSTLVQTTSPTNKNVASNKLATDQPGANEETTVVGNKLPQVLAAKSKKIATVSSSFSTKKTHSGAFLPLTILGSLLILGAGVYFVKRKMKSGQSENSDQPL